MFLFFPTYLCEVDLENHILIRSIVVKLSELSLILIRNHDVSLYHVDATGGGLTAA